MGRNKISIKKLEPASQRTNTFSKRSKGIKKKAEELSIISDAQVLLLLRTTTGKYDLFHDENSSFDGVVQKFISETQKNLQDSRSDGMDLLRKKFKSESDTLNAISLMDHGTCPTDDKQQGSDQEMRLKNIKLEVSNLESQLGSLRNIKEIEMLEKLDELTAMENSIMELLSMNDQQSRMESSTAMYNRNMDEIEKLDKYDELVKMDNSLMELPSMNDQQSRMESSTAMYNSNALEEAKLLAEAMDWYQVVEGRAAQQYYPALEDDYEAGLFTYGNL